MTTQTINEWKKTTATWEHIPQWIKNLICEVLDKYGMHVCENSSWSGSTEIYPIELWKESAYFFLTTDDKRIFKQKTLDKFVERYPQLKNVYLKKPNDGCYRGYLVFSFKKAWR